MKYPGAPYEKIMVYGEIILRKSSGGWAGVCAMIREYAPWKKINQTGKTGWNPERDAPDFFVEEKWCLECIKECVRCTILYNRWNIIKNAQWSCKIVHCINLKRAKRRGESEMAVSKKQAPVNLKAGFRHTWKEMVKYRWLYFLLIPRSEEHTSELQSPS